LGTDSVDVVVKATVARAGQIAPAAENSDAEPAPPTAETSAGSFFQSTEEMRQSNVEGWSGYPPKLSVKAGIPDGPFR
jgi:hypothetical protein